MQTFRTCAIKPNLSNIVRYSHVKVHVCLFPTDIYHYDTASSLPDYVLIESTNSVQDHLNWESDTFWEPLY